MTPGMSDLIVLKFQVNTESGKKNLKNYAEIGVMNKVSMIGKQLSPRRSLDPNEAPAYTGQPQLFNAGETSNNNNITQAVISLPTYDLSITKSVLSGTVAW